MSTRSARKPATSAKTSRRSGSTPRRASRPSLMSSRDCTVLALVLVERLSLTEAAEALDVPVTQLRRDYEAALVRVRRSIAPLLARADLARALSRPAPAWRKAS